MVTNISINLILVVNILLNVSFADTESSSKKKVIVQEKYLKKISKTQKGFFKGIKKNGNHKHFNIVDCIFSYEKGVDIYQKDGRDYGFERIVIGYMGKDKNNETSFDSVNYTNAEYLKEFVAWDFSKSFGPVKLQSKIKFGGDENNGEMTFRKKEGDGAIITLKHSDIFDTAKSSFFIPGEKRHYVATLDFKHYSEKKIELDSLSVKGTSIIKNKKGKYQAPISIVDVSCSSFVKVDMDN